MVTDTFGSLPIVSTPYFWDFLDYYKKAKVLQDECNLGGKPYIGMVGDDLMEQVTIYDTVERRYAGFSNMLQDLWLGAKNPKFFKQSVWHQAMCNAYVDQHERWDMEDWIYVFLVHRLTGSGASFERDHGYRNTILPQLHDLDGINDMAAFIRVHHAPMFTSIGNQIPAFPKPNEEFKTGGKRYLCTMATELARHLAGFLENMRLIFDRKATIRELVDLMCDFNRNLGVNAFHFVFTAVAADLADYYPHFVDANSHMYYGKNAKESMDLMFKKVGKITKDQFYDAVMEAAQEATGGAPRDLEDVMCDYVRYIENYIPDNREQTYAHLDRSAVWNNSSITDHPKGRQRHLELA